MNTRIKKTKSTNPMKYFLDKYLFSDFKSKNSHIRYIKYDNGNILVLDGITETEFIELDNNAK